MHGRRILGMPLAYLNETSFTLVKNIATNRMNLLKGI